MHSIKKLAVKLQVYSFVKNSGTQFLNFERF